MASNPNAKKLKQITGTANSQMIAFFAGAYEYSTTRYVTLSSNYQRTPPMHFPDCNAGVKRGTSLTAGAMTLLSGTRVQFYAPEAAALVAAGAATYS